MSSSGKVIQQQDRKDLEKYTKFFIYKTLQIIVQSRLGEKIRTKSKPFSSGTDWFNLAVRDIPEVQAEAKKALSNQQPILGQNVCVEISLKTAEGDQMVLETWYIGMNTEQSDMNVRVSYTVYNRMSIALKSLFSVSRVVPAYKISRRQGACSDDYVICYRIYGGNPQFFQLGEGYKMTKVGQVPTPTGTILINLAYRTKMMISPHKQSKESLIEVKDDHFKQDNSPKRATTPKPCSLGYRRESVAEDLGMVFEEGQDSCSTTFSTSPPDYSQPQGQNGRVPSQPIKINQALSPDVNIIHSASGKQTSFTNFHKVGAFVQHRTPKDLNTDLEDVPFLSLLKNNKVKAPDINNTQDISKIASTEENITEMGSTETLSESSHSSQASAPGDFVMVELKTPFAGVDANSDLGKFFRDCQGAPPLTTFDENNATETLDQITNQLAAFESNMKDFDDFVCSLNESGNDDI
ncbi:hypothetical protein ScPMuIL_010779 [Solemya velum]